MNKKILYAVAACTVLFSSCGGANGKPSTADANAIIEYNNTSLEVLKSLYSERETNNVLEYTEKHGKTLFAPVAAKQPAVSCKVFPFNFVPCILRQGPRQYGNR